jgi:hypothetical protein
VDRTGRPWPEPVLERLRRRAPERVVAASSQSSTRESLRALLARVVAGPREPILAGLDLARWHVRSTTVLATCDWAGPGPLFVTLLPRAPTPEARARLAPLELGLPSGGDPRVEWLHPEDGGILPPGDAAVLLIRR